jgi:hypothetical protein
LWRAAPRRLKAEQLRDSILAASGRLDLEPPHYSVAAEFGDGYYGVNIWETDLPQHYYKRSVYLPIPRDMVPDALSLFDLPNPNLVGAKREETTSPSQALFLMNNAFVQDEALHIARKLEEDKKLSEQERITHAYLAIYQRQPTSEEVQRASRFIESQSTLLASALPEESVPRTSSPELDAASVARLVAPKPEIPAVANQAMATDATATPSPAVADATNIFTVAINSTSFATVTNDFAPGGGFRRPPRTFNGPGSASDIVVGKLAPGIAQPKVFHQALPEKPASPEEGAFAELTQALFASAEFRYLQ